jgi:hypothetical protein
MKRGGHSLRWVAEPEMKKKYPCYDREAQIHIIYIFKATNPVPMKQRPRIINHVAIMNFQRV